MGLFPAAAPFGIPAGNGFIALLRISTMEGVIVLSTSQQPLAKGRKRSDAVVPAADARLPAPIRPRRQGGRA